MNGTPPRSASYYSQFDPATLEGLMLLAQERCRLAEQQVPGLQEHIAEQQQVISELTARYNSDVAFINGAAKFLRQQQAPQLPPPIPQQAPYFAPPPSPSHQFAALPNVDGVARIPVQQPLQRPLAIAEQGGTPLPYPNQQVHSSVIEHNDARRRAIESGERRSHLIPDGKGGLMVDPNFVDEQGRRPVQSITPEMRATWAKEAQRAVEVYLPGTEGHVPAGGGRMEVRVHTPETSPVSPAGEVVTPPSDPVVVEQGPGT
jgi:hypothetical protein